MRSAASQAFGTFTFVARAAAPPLGGGPPPANSFACLTTSYRSAPHHEIASCFRGAAPSNVSLAYWSEGANSRGVILEVDTGLRLHEAFHTYVVTWTPTALSLSVDGRRVAHAEAAANSTLPFLPGQALLINRVSSEPYLGDAVVALASAAYAPLAL
jgi:beta-glucanase (GH16 family)